MLTYLPSDSLVLERVLVIGLGSPFPYDWTSPVRVNIGASGNESFKRFTLIAGLPDVAPCPRRMSVAPTTV